MSKTLFILFAFCIIQQAGAQSEVSTVTLSDCIEAALANNPVIKQADIDVQISNTGINIAKSGLFPTVSMQASGGISNEYRVGNDYKTGGTQLTASQVLWQKGILMYSIKQAKYIEAASMASFEARKQDIIVSVKSAYYLCIQQLELYRLSLDNISKAELFLEYARERYKIGTGRKSDVLKAESDLTEARFESNSYFNSMIRVQNELSMLTGLSPGQLSKPDSSLLSLQFLAFTGEADSLIDMAFSKYPELQAINNLGLSQNEKIKETRSELYPQFGINAGYNWNYNPVIQSQEGWFSLFTLRWNIFAGNEKRYRMQSEQLKYNGFNYQAEELKDFLIKEVNNRIINIKEAEEQIILINSMMKTTGENLEIAKAQYLAGTGSMLELTDARVTGLLTRQKNIQAITAYLIAVANLERLTGINHEIKYDN